MRGWGGGGAYLHINTYAVCVQYACSIHAVCMCLCGGCVEHVARAVYACSMHAVYVCSMC